MYNQMMTIIVTAIQNFFDQTNPTKESPMVGFSADTYPFFGSYIFDNQTV